MGETFLRALLRIIACMATCVALGATAFALFAYSTPLLTDLEAISGTAYLAAMVAGIWFGCSALLGCLLDRIGLPKVAVRQASQP